MAGLFDDCCTRELVLREGITVSVAEQHTGLDGEPGGVVWDSALVLAHYLATATDRGRIRLGAARVLELGAGTGCAGLAAAALGAAEVVLTDRPQLLPLLQHNIELNKLGGVARVASLEWGEPLPQLLPAPKRGQDDGNSGADSDCCATAATAHPRSDEQHKQQGQQQEQEQVQQQEQEQEQGQEQEQEQGSKQQQQQQQECLLRPPYDIVLCADCVYTPASALPLLETLRQLLGPRSVALAACEMRTGAGLEQLHAALPEAGLVEALVPYTELHPDWCSPDILVWRITRLPTKPKAK